MSAQAMRTIHLWLTLAWLAFMPIAMLAQPLRQSVPLLVGISVYANVAGHFSAWQAARAEQEAA